MESLKLEEGGKARIKHTGQLVEVRRVSTHGIAIVAFRTGGEYIMPHHYLVPVNPVALTLVKK